MKKLLESKPWLKSGISWAIFMFVAMVIIFPLIKGEGITVRQLLVGIPFWLVCGLGLGYFIGKLSKSSTQS